MISLNCRGLGQGQRKCQKVGLLDLLLVIFSFNIKFGIVMDVSSFKLWQNGGQTDHPIVRGLYSLPLTTFSLALNLT